MKINPKKILLLSTVLIAAASVLAEVSFRAPIVLNVDGEDFSGGAQMELEAAPEAASRADELVSSAADVEKLKTLLVDPKKIGKAQKFLSLLDGKGLDAVYSVRLGGHSCVFFKTASPKMRTGMNCLVFDRSDGWLKWNVDFRDPLLSMLGESVQKTKWIMNRETAADGAPKVIFKSGELKDCTPDKDVENCAAAKFYHSTQKLFFELKLKEYSEYYTPASREKFAAQFLDLGKVEQKKALSEYISWHKKYIKCLDAGGVKILLFKREKAGEKDQFDQTWFKDENGELRICNYGSSKSTFERFLESYFLSDVNYAEEFEKRFGTEN